MKMFREIENKKKIQNPGTRNITIINLLIIQGFLLPYAIFFVWVYVYFLFVFTWPES